MAGMNSGHARIPHRILHDPRKAAALVDLQANPVGSLEWWGKRWSMKRDAVHRFLNALMRAGVVIIATSAGGTQVTFLDDDSDSSPTRSDREQGVRDAAAMHPRSVAVPSRPLASLASCSTGPSESFPQTAANSVDVVSYGGEEGTYTEKLIRAMNRACRETFGSAHRTIQDDNRGSNRAGPQLEAEGVPIGFAIEQLVLGVRRFNVLKHGKGSLPRTVAYFAPGISEKWSQPEFTLLSMEQGGAEDSPDEIKAGIADLKRRIGA